MSGLEKDDQSKSCSHDWKMFLATEDFVWFCCPICGQDRFVSARYIDELFTYDGMSLSELESYGSEADKEQAFLSKEEALQILRERNKEDEE